MENTNKHIAELQKGDTLSGVFLVKKAETKLNSNNNWYVEITLADKTGEILGRSWKPDPNVKNGIWQKEEADAFTTAAYVMASFEVGEFNGKKQAEKMSMSIKNPDELTEEELSELIPCIKEDREELFQKLYGEMQSLETDRYRELACSVLDEYKGTLLTIPAAEKAHHAEIGGLLEHTWEVVNVVKQVHVAMPYFNKEFTMMCACVHDIGKLKEFQQSKVGLVEDYTMQGKLLGHIYMGALEMGFLAKNKGFDDEEKILLQHMILSHHGKKEWGSPVEPMLIEAHVLHAADDLSAKMHEFRDAVEYIEPGKFSDKIWSLNKNQVFKPVGSIAEFQVAETDDMNTEGYQYQSTAQDSEYNNDNPMDYGLDAF